MTKLENNRDRDNQIRNKSIDGFSYSELAKEYGLSRERIRVIINDDCHPKYYEYCYHNEAVGKFLDTLREIEDQINSDLRNGKLNPRLWCHIKTANAIAELLDTWKPNESNQIR